MTTNGSSLAPSNVSLEEILNSTIQQKIHLVERLDELELALENKDWIRVGWQSENEFSRAGLKTISRLSRIFFLKNPLIKRGVKLHSFYIFGRGVSISAKDETINDVIQAFIDDKENQLELLGAIARKQKDIDLRLDGNLFIVLFVHPATGKVRVSTIDPNEIEDIICDPENRNKVWYYKRIWSYNTFDLATGEQKTETKTRYYKDFRYTNDRSKIGDIEVDNNPIYHIKVGGFSNWRFGVSEVYSALDWAKAYKSFLEDFATVTKALAKFAWNVKVKGGSRAVAAAKTKLGTTFASSSDAGGTETNPAPTAASTWINDDVPLDPIKTANSTTPADSGRPMRHMVASGVDLPDPMLSGDPQQGALATAKTLDRPTELGFLDRQELWKEVYANLIDYVIYQSVIAPNGELNAIANIIYNEYGEQVIEFNGDINQTIDIDFPPVLERDTKEYISAIVSAVTLDGKAPMVIKDLKYIARIMLTSLGFDDIDETLDELFPEGEEQTIAVPEQSIQDLNDTLEALRETIASISSG